MKNKQGLKYFLITLLCISVFVGLFIIYSLYFRRAPLPLGLVNKTWVAVKYSHPDREYRRLLQYPDPILKTHHTSYEDMLANEPHQRIVREVGFWTDSIDRLKRFEGNDSVVQKFYLTYGELSESLIDRYRVRDKTAIRPTTDIFTTIDSKQGIYRWLQRETLKEFLIMDYEKAQHLPFIDDALLPELQNKHFYLIEEWKGYSYVNLNKDKYRSITSAKRGTEFILDNVSMGTMDKVEPVQDGWNLMFPSASGANLISYDGYRYYPDVDTLKIRRTKAEGVYDLEQRIKESNEKGESETITNSLRLADKGFIDSLIRKDPVEALNKGYSGVIILPEFYLHPVSSASYELREKDSLGFSFLVKDINELIKFKYSDWKRTDTAKTEIKKGYNTYDKLAVIEKDSIQKIFFFSNINRNIYKLLHEVSIVSSGVVDFKLVKIERTHDSFSFVLQKNAVHTEYLYDLINDRWELSSVQEVDSKGSIINNYKPREEKRRPESFYEFNIIYPFDGFEKN